MTNGFLLAGDLETGLIAALAEIGRACGVDACVILRGLDGRMESKVCGGVGFGVTEKEMATAGRVFETGEPIEEEAPGVAPSPMRWIPLAGKSGVLGVLGSRISGGGPLPSDSVRRLRAFAGQLSLLLDWECGSRARAIAAAEAVAEASRRRLIDLVSHELKSPLAALEAALEGLNAQPAEAAFYLEESLRALGRLGRTVDNLLDVGRLETGSVKPRSDWCDIAEICETAIELAGDVLRGRDVQREFLAGAPLIKVDETLVCHALVHLLHNAATHSPPLSDIMLKARADHEGVEIEVLDRGPGLQADEKDKVFEKFFKGKRAPAGSAGLGLTIVRGFIRSLGGDVGAEDRAGGGATFRIRIPCQTMPMPTGSPGGGALSAGDS